MSQSLNNIQSIIEKNIPLINYHSWSNNDKPKTDGEYYVSEEYLNSVKENDIVIGREFSLMDGSIRDDKVFIFYKKSI